MYSGERTPFSISRASTAGDTFDIAALVDFGRTQPAAAGPAHDLAALPTGTVRNGVPAAADSNKTSGEYSTLEAKTNKSASKNASTTFSRGRSTRSTVFCELATTGSTQELSVVRMFAAIASCLGDFGIFASFGRLRKQTIDYPSQTGLTEQSNAFPHRVQAGEPL